MFRLIMISIFLIILAIFIVFNASYTTGFSLFSIKIESVPTVTVIIISFVIGVLFSMGIYFGNYFRQFIKSRFKKKQMDLKQKESVIKQKEIEEKKQEKEDIKQEKKSSRLKTKEKISEKTKE